MSDDATTQRIKKAYELIKTGDRSQAVRLLSPILQADKDNAAAWWLLANAASKPEHVRQALQNVLRLRPGDTRARAMLDKLESRAAPVQLAPSPTLSKPPAESPAAPAPRAADNAFLDQIDDEGDPFAVLDADDDPFVGVEGLPLKRSPAGHASASSVNRHTAIVGVTLVTVILVLGAAVFAVLNMDSTPGRPESSGHCNIGQPGSTGPEVTLVTCSSDVVPGQLWTGFMNPYENHEWRIRAEAGDNLTIEVNAAAPENDPTRADPIVAMYEENGSLLGRNDDYGDTYNSRLDVIVPNSSTYRIEISTFGNQGGRYELYVRRTGNALAASSDTATPQAENASTSGHCDAGRMSESLTIRSVPCGGAASGARVTGRLNANEEHSWTFSGQAGQVLIVEVDARDIDTDPVVALYGPDGMWLAENDDIDTSAFNYNSRLSLPLPSTGTYRIVVRTFLHVGGQYEMRVR